MINNIEKIEKIFNKLNGISINEIENEFYNVADIIFNYGKIIVNDTTFLIREIEFYYYKDIEHEDMFTHKNAKQKEMLKWYFHGAGVDITFGNKNAYGGILIRSILKVNAKNSSNNVFIDGSINTFDALFSFQKNVTEQNSIQLMFSEKPNYRNEIDIIKSLRVGLSFKKDIDIETQKNFIAKKYRFVVFDKENPKQITQKNKFVLTVSANENGLDTKAVLDKSTYNNYLLTAKNAKEKQVDYKKYASKIGTKLTQHEVIELMFFNHSS